MTSSNLLYALSILFFVLVIISLVSFNMGRRFQRDYERLTGTGKNGGASEPKVIVNIPEDLKPFPRLTDEGHLITGERAVLYWSVYSKAMDDPYVDEPSEHARKAVETVFGPLPPEPLFRYTATTTTTAPTTDGAN